MMKPIYLYVLATVLSSVVQSKRSSEIFVLCAIEKGRRKLTWYKQNVSESDFNRMVKEYDSVFCVTNEGPQIFVGLEDRETVITGDLSILKICPDHTEFRWFPESDHDDLERDPIKGCLDLLFTLVIRGYVADAYQCFKRDVKLTLDVG